MIKLTFKFSVILYCKHNLSIYFEAECFFHNHTEVEQKTPCLLKSSLSSVECIFIMSIHTNTVQMVICSNDSEVNFSQGIILVVCDSLPPRRGAPPKM